MVDFAAAPAPSFWSRGIGRWALLAAGSLCVAIGVVGLFLPLLPSFEFFLLAGICYGKSSEAASRWLTTNRLFGRHFRDYRDHRGASIPTKVFTLVLLWAGMGASMALLGLPAWALAALALVGGAISWHVLALRTVRG